MISSCLEVISLTKIFIFDTFYVIIKKMKLKTSLFYRLFCSLSISVFILSLLFGVILSVRPTYAESNNTDNGIVSDSHFVTFHDDSKSLTIKTNAKTVKEALERAKIHYNPSDRVEPALNEEINSDIFHINIYRSRPVIIKSGTTRKFVMSASLDPKEMAEDAGMTIYDGDELKPVSSNILESGVATVYQLIRNGGRTITVEEDIPYQEKTVNDTTLPTGQTNLRQVGELGRKSTVYQVNFIDGKEASRTLVSTNIIKNPVDRVTAVGMKKSVPPEWEACASYARAAGVSEANIYAALTLIYRESGCRFDASNASGAYGIPQALPGSKMSSAGADWRTNPVTQIRWMSGYVTGRYGGWQQAWSFWQSHRWY